MSNSSKRSVSKCHIDNLFTKNGFELVLSMDCEGTNYDKNLKNNILNLERFLKSSITSS